MITKNQDTPFIAELKPSKNLYRLVLIIHLIAIVAAAFSALPLVAKLTIATVIVLNFMANFPQLKHEQRKIRHTEKWGWEIANGGDFAAVTILPSTVVTTFLIFLHIQNQPAILIANDALSNDHYRQLLVKLKITIH